MKHLILILLSIVLFAPESFAHGGRTDSCGGHNDRKRGGYHVHNQAKYNNCYPEKKKTSSQTSKILTCEDKIKQACNNAFKKCLDVCADSKCKSACIAGKANCK